MSLETNVSSAFTRVATEFKTLRTSISGSASGSLAGLTTTQKGSLIAAINELDAAVDALIAQPTGPVIADGTTTTTSVWSSSKTNTAITAAVAAIVDSSPAALNTLNELAEALGDDPSFATTITNQLASKAAAVHTHTASQITDFNTSVDSRVAAAVPAASTTVAGKIETATDVEAIAGGSTTVAVTPANLLAYVGNPNTNFVTLFEAGLI